MQRRVMIGILIASLVLNGVALVQYAQGGWAEHEAQKRIVELLAPHPEKLDELASRGDIWSQELSIIHLDLIRAYELMDFFGQWNDDLEELKLEAWEAFRTLDWITLNHHTLTPTEEASLLTARDKISELINALQ